MNSGTGFAEEQPRIPIRLLKREGLLDEPGRKIALRTAGLDVVVVSMDPSNALIFWKDQEEYRQELIDHSVNYLRFGERPVFVCSLTGANCHELFLYRGRWASAKGHGLRSATRHGNRHGRRRAKLESIDARLRGAEGLPRARGPNRSRLVNRALTVPYATQIVPGLGEEAAEVERQQQLAVARLYRSNRKRGPYSTEAALAGGEAALYRGVSSDDPKDLLATIQSHKAPPFDLAALSARPLIKLESCAALDARVVSRIWSATKASLTTLIWPKGMEGTTQFVLVADFSVQLAPIVGLSRQNPDGRSFQSLSVEPAGLYKPGNWVFLCPVLATRHDVLFLRDGLFASAKAQRLVHASQRR